MNTKNYCLSWSAFLNAFAILIIVASSIENRIVVAGVGIVCIVIMSVGFYYGLEGMMESPVNR